MLRTLRRLLPLLVLVSASTSAEEPARNALTFGVGLGRARVSGTGSVTGWALRLRAVTPVAARVELGLEALSETSVFDSLSTVDVAATYYPVAGFFVRGGVGASRREGATGPWSATEVEDVGANALAGLGYALGGTRGLAASINLEGQLHLFDRQGGWERSESAVLWLGLDWR
ncbi:MAG: hypothetical protein QM704_05030 [Anaeromyxobacteraceae bacterium]